jgi:polysaccharide transporter, PST family
MGWFGLSQAWSICLTIGSTLILARLLLPADFAVMAFIGPLLTAGQMLQMLGTGGAIIQAKEVTKAQLDALFWLTLGFSSILALLLALVGPLFASWLMGLDLSRELAFASLLLIITVFGSLTNVQLSRQLRFRELAWRNMISTAIGTAVGVGLAIAWRNHWALLVPPVLTTALNAMLTMGLVRWFPGRPRLTSGLRPMLSFGLRIWATNLLTFISRNSDNFIVAGAATPHQLGLYSRSFAVLMLPMNQAVGPLGQILIPTLTRTVDDPPRYQAQFWRALLLLQFVCLPALALVVIYPQTLIGLVLGPSWLEAARMFGWFAIAGMVEIVLAGLAWLLQSQGRGGDALHGGLVTAVIAVASFVIGINWGIEGVAVAFALGRSMLCLPYMLWLTGRTGPILLGCLLSGLIPHGAALLAALAVLAGLRAAFGLPLWPMLIASLAAGYAAYAAVLLAIPQSRKLVLGAAAALLQRR